MSVRGFTLIELIVTTGLILMILAVTLPSFLSFQHRQILISGGQALRQAIVQTQNYALAPRAPTANSTGIPAGANLYRIIFIPANNGYDASYEIDEQTNMDKTNPTWQTVKKEYLAYGLNFCAFSDSNMISSALPLVDPNQDRLHGIFYSISDYGKIISPVAPSGLWLTIRQNSLVEQEKLMIQQETGSINVDLVNPPPASCG